MATIWSATLGATKAYAIATFSSFFTTPVFPIALGIVAFVSYCSYNWISYFYYWVRTTINATNSIMKGSKIGSVTIRI